MFLCEELSANHDLSQFESGEPDLDDWLRTSARDSDGRRITKTYVWHDGSSIVVGYYAVMPFTLESDDLTKSQARGMPATIPCYLLARLAIDRSLHGQHLGSQLLASALERLVHAAEAVGGRYIVVDSISSGAAAFYAHHGFRPIASSPDRLVLSVRDVSNHLSTG